MNDFTETSTIDASSLEQVAEIVAAYVSNNAVRAADLPMLIATTHTAIRSLSAHGQSALALAQKPAEELRPAVPIKKSVTPEFIICLEDGKKFKSMKRHVTNLGMTPEEYRIKWGLPADYPMVAPNYAVARSAMAKSSGLGRKRKGKSS